MTGVNEITLESFTTQMLTDFKTLADTMYGAIDMRSVKIMGNS